MGKKGKRELKEAEWYGFNCPICRKYFERYSSLVKTNWKQFSDGPFCSKVCSSIARFRFSEKEFGKTKIIKRFHQQCPTTINKAKEKSENIDMIIHIYIHIV